MEHRDIFVTSDSHAYHRNIAGPKVSSWDKGYRNFDNEFVMTDEIVKSYNDIVKPNDILIHLGDWSFGGVDKVKKFRDRINTNFIILIHGNHDKAIKAGRFNDLFIERHDYLEYRYKKQLFVMCHYAFRVWNKSHHGSIHLYGHSHHTLPGVGKSMDVGWCKWRRPLHLDEVLGLMQPQQVEVVDHHNNETRE